MVKELHVRIPLLTLTGKNAAQMDFGYSALTWFSLLSMGGIPQAKGKNKVRVNIATRGRRKCEKCNASGLVSRLFLFLLLHY